MFACPASILIVLANSDRFVDYYSLFLGHGVICIVVEHQTVLADSSPFRGLLLIILGSRSDLHDW